MKKYIKSNIELSIKVLRELEHCAWGADVLDILLNYTSDKLEGFDNYGEYFDVSYIGTAKELCDELFHLLKDAGFNPHREQEARISFDNDGMNVDVTIVEDDEASTYSENSTGYFIYVEDWE